MVQKIGDQVITQAISAQRSINGATNYGFTCDSDTPVSRKSLSICINNKRSAIYDMCYTENIQTHEPRTTYVNVGFSKTNDDVDLHKIELAENGAVEKNGPKGQQNGGNDNVRDTTVATCRDPVYRQKILETVLLFWSMTMQGYGYGQIGPALPDLQKIGGVPLQVATWLFTGYSIGYLIGCLLAGIIRDKVNLRLMMFLYTSGVAIVMGMLPWLPSFVAMVICRVFNGIFLGGQDTVTHSLLFAIWLNDSGPVLQAAHCFFALGGILSPLVTRPFLSKISDQPYGNYSNYSLPNLTMLDKVTDVPTATPGIQTNVHYAFLINAILKLSSAIPFLLIFLSKRGIAMSTRQDSNASDTKKTSPSKVKNIVLCILIFNSFVATASIDMFPNFLTTFVISQLGWTPQNGSDISSLFFGAYGFGNFIGIFVLKYSTTTKLITASYISSCLAIAGFYIGVLYEQNEIIWIVVTFAGLAMSSILPTFFTWTQENVTSITTRVASYLLISGSLGVMLDPMLIGYLMDQYAPLCFLYVNFTELVICSIVFTLAFILSRLYLSQPRSQNDHVRPENVTSDHKLENIDAKSSLDKSCKDFSCIKM